jgi:putative DNA methylase
MNPAQSPVRKKLIEVSIPLEAINAASAREKSIRHGHPSTLHLWWARRPLAACRAVLFAQLVDDPSAWPERFGGEEAQEAERKRLHGVIARMVEWPSDSKPGDRQRFESAVEEARWEIARSVAWGRGEEPPARDDDAAILACLQEKAPPVYDPFCGGGSIPLEAQRLGLRAYGSDLNPVAVLISKALVEIPPKFAGRPPVYPNADLHKRYRGAQGLAEDVRYYGQWMRDEAERRIGHLYPKARLPDGSEATVIVWLWARTVRSPDPRAKGAMVPLVSSFVLSTKEGRKAWVEPVINPTSPDGWHFEVRTGALAQADEERLKKGTKGGDRGSTFSCVLTGASIRGDYVKSEGMAGRMSERLMAIVAEGSRQRIYLSPNPEDERLAAGVADDGRVADAREGPLNEPVPERLTGGTCYSYGLTTIGKLFTPRQLVALTTFSDLVGEAREKVVADARAAGLPDDPTQLHQGGTGAAAYADAVATYFGLAVDRMADRHSSLTRWDPNPTGYAPKIANTFSRQALPMVWDHTEGNPFSSSSGNFEDAVQWITKNIRVLGTRGCGEVNQIDAAKNNFSVRPVLIATDPPYYDNIGYADLSDFFYVWLKRSTGGIWPDLFRRLTTPKNEELVATPYRHGGREQAEAFFMDGMSVVLTAMSKAATDREPVTMYYAFKQSELAEEGIVSSGWASFLQAIVDAKLAVNGTWPVRTELSNRLIARDANALASSVVLACRKRPENAPTVTRADFLRALRREMPEAVDKIRKANVGPVDMPQSVIGPGMGVFTRYARVLEDDDSAMSVKTALALINRVWGEIEDDLDANFDPETQVALAWFSTYGFDARASGDLINVATAKNTTIEALFRSGVFQNLNGKGGLIPRDKLRENWSPDTDRTPTVWECVQHTARVLRDDEGGGAEAAAKLVAAMGSRAEAARALAYRLYQIAHDKGWAAEALVYNELAQDWTQLEDKAAQLQIPAARDLFGEVAR